MKELCHGGTNSLTNFYSLRGASAGALAAVLGACQVDTDQALSLAHKLALELGVFERPLGLVGVWGGMLRTWLHELLPEDAAERCSNGKVQVVVTAFPRFKREIISNFNSKNEVIDACLASAHVPFLMDGKFAARINGQRVIDGALLDAFQQAKQTLVGSGFLPSWVTMKWGPFAVVQSENNKGKHDETKMVVGGEEMVHLSYHHDEELRKKG